jgi:hypothetical protein
MAEQDEYEAQDARPQRPEYVACSAPASLTGY